ncbi:hypothetical protein SVIOM74S_07014 [Streptomyces violarus]
MKIWLDGDLQDTESARVSVFDHGLTVGDGIFETVKAVDGRPFALTRHLDRLTRSARGLGLPDPDHDEVRRACEGVLVLLQGEVPQPQLHAVAVAGAQGTEVVQRGTAVRALEVAPDLEDGGGGRGGGGVAHTDILPGPTPAPAPAEEATRRCP